MAEAFISEIRIFPFNFAPRQWTFCSGQLLSISEFQTVFALIGNIYGGDGRTTMGVPDLRGRMPIGQGAAPGLSGHQLGQFGGVESVSLNTNHMASHDHTATFTATAGGNVSVDTTLAVSTAAGKTETPAAGDYLAAGTASGRPEAQIYIDADSKGSTVDLGGVSSTASGGITGGTVTVNNNGGGQAFGVANPYLALNFCMALDGIFPSRN